MINYDFGSYGIGILFQWHGSVFARSFTVAVPVAVLSGICHWSFNYSGEIWKTEEEKPEFKGLVSLWGTFTFTLGFLLVFRTQIAYQRYWNGLSELMRTRTVWLNAASNLIAFTSRDEKKKFETREFEQIIIRLFSLLYCVAVQQVAFGMDKDSFYILEGQGSDILDPESMKFFYQSPDRIEVLVQWIQSTMVGSLKTGVLDVAPPILSRVFQEISNGVGSVYQAYNIAQVPFPFPYAQMVSFLLTVHLVATPLICSVAVSTTVASIFISFIGAMGLWSLNFISAEIEMPFGDDPNDLPVLLLQNEFNRKLVALCDPQAQQPPRLKDSKAVFQHTLVVRSADVVERQALGLFSAQGTMGRVSSDIITASAAFSSEHSMQAEAKKIGDAITGQEEKRQKKIKELRKKDHWAHKHAHGWEQKLQDLTGKEVSMTKGQREGLKALREVDSSFVPDGVVWTETLSLAPAPPTPSGSQNIDDRIAVIVKDEDPASANTLPIAAANGGSIRSGSGGRGGGSIGAALPDGFRPGIKPGEVKLVSGQAKFSEGSI